MSQLSRRRPEPFELPDGNDVEAASGANEKLQHRQIRVGLHRVADEVISIRQAR
jgi:hypothetical protein